MKKADVILVISVLALSVVCGIFLILNARKNSAGWVIAERDGKEILRLSLSQNQSVRIEDGAGGYNVVTVQDGTACVSEADCPDRICVNQGKIRIQGETVVCLPHRLLIRLEGVDASGETIDAMTCNGKHASRVFYYHELARLFVRRAERKEHEKNGDFEHADRLCADAFLCGSDDSPGAGNSGD